MIFRGWELFLLVVYRPSPLQLVLLDLKLDGPIFHLAALLMRNDIKTKKTFSPLGTTNWPKLLAGNNKSSTWVLFHLGGLCAWLVWARPGGDHLASVMGICCKCVFVPSLNLLPEHSSNAKVCKAGRNPCLKRQMQELASQLFSNAKGLVCLVSSPTMWNVNNALSCYHDNRALEPFEYLEF